MKNIIKWILSAFIGIFASFVLALINESWHQLITCAMVALAMSAIVYYAISEKSELRYLITVAIFIIVFILYFFIYSSVNESESMFWWLLIFFGPYIIATYILLAATNNDSN